MRFSNDLCSGGSKSRLAKAAGARWEMKNCTLLWREAHFQVKASERFQKLRCRKVHAVVARSTFPSQNVQNTPGSEHFSKLRCWKSVRRFGAKHISKSKCTKHTRFGALFEVDMSEMCSRCGAKRISQVKTLKTPHARTDVVSCGRRKGLWPLSKVSKTWGFSSSFSYNHHCTTRHSTTLQYTTTKLQLQLQLQLQLPLHYTYTYTYTCTCTYTTLITLHYNYNYHYITLH